MNLLVSMVRWNHRVLANWFNFTLVLFIFSSCGLPVDVVLNEPTAMADDPNDDYVGFITPSDATNIKSYVILYKIKEISQSTTTEENAFDPDSYTGNSELPAGLTVPYQQKFFMPINLTTPGLNSDTDDQDFFSIPHTDTSQAIRIRWENKNDLPRITKYVNPNEIVIENLCFARKLSLVFTNPSSSAYYQAGFLNDFHYDVTSPDPDDDPNPIDSDLKDMYSKGYTSVTNITILFCVISRGYDPSTMSLLYSQPVYIGEISLPFNTNLNTDIRD